MLEVVCHDYQSLADGLACDNHIKFINRFALLFQRILDTGIFFPFSLNFQNGKIFKQRVNFLNFTSEVLRFLLTSEVCLFREAQNDDCLARSFSVLLHSSNLHNEGSAICAQIPRRSYAGGHVQVLPALPDVLPATDGCLGSNHSACGECFQVKVLCSYFMCLFRRCKDTNKRAKMQMIPKK